MDVSDAAYATVHDYPGGAQALGPRIAVGGTVLSHKVSPTNTTHHLTLDESVRVMELTGDHRILVALCRRLGYVAPIKAVRYDGIADDALLDLLGKMYAEGGDVARALTDALADGNISREELARLEDEAHQAASAIAELVDRVRGIAARR